MRRAPAETAESEITDTVTPSTTPAEDACAAVAVPTTLADAKDAGNVYLVGKAVFFQSGTKVLRVFKDGTGKKEIVDSPNLVAFYADKNALILIETTGASPEATIRVIKADVPEVAEGETPPEPEFPEFTATIDGALAGTTTATNYNAGSARVFASTDASFFLSAEDGNGNSMLLDVSKDVPDVRTTIVTTTNVITNPQVTGGALWYVRDYNRVFRVTLADPENETPQGEPLEVFGIQYATCNLAVGESAAYCSVGSAVERRDLTGANPATILDATRSKAQAGFGRVVNAQGALFVQSDEPDAKIKHVIRAVKPSEAGAEESFAACGRNLVTSLAVDATHVAWVEKDTGVYIVTR